MDEPITREEMFLAKAAGENVNIPEPITRKEQYLKKIAENGGSGGGGGGGSSDVMILHIVDSDTGEMDATWQEVADAISAGKIVICPIDFSGFGGPVTLNQILAAYNTQNGELPYTIFNNIYIYQSGPFAGAQTANGTLYWLDS